MVFAQVKRGQLIGVIGPVGGGKTTLLHAIVGELQRLGGSIHLDKVSFTFICNNVF